MIDRDPFVGREPELALLREAFEGARAGRGGAVLVSGEAGIGKTRLVRELEDLARASDAIVVWGRSQEVRGAPPYWPWAQVLEALMRAAEGAMDLSVELEGSAPSLARVAPALGATVPPTVDEHTEEPESARFQLFVAVERLLQRVAEAAPVVVVLDDLQWADPATLSLLEFLASGLADDRVLLAATCRDVEAGSLGGTLAALARSPGFRAIDLGGLEVGDVARYLEHAVGSAPSCELARSMHDRTGGNPFFVRELGRLMADARADVLPREVPASIRAAIERRVARLSEG